MINQPTGQHEVWVKSTRSGSNGDCVEIATNVEGVAVRDSKDPHGPILRFSQGSWRDFIAGIRDGNFD